MAEEVVLVGGARTPFCEWLGGKRGDGEVGGRLAEVSAEQLGTIAIKGALEKTGTSPQSIDHVVMGHALQTSDQAIFGARHAGLNAGIPHEVPMLTLNRLCGSGVQSIISAAQMIKLGEAKTVIAGGMENLSQAPHVLRHMRSTFKLGRPPRAGYALEKDMEDYLFTNLLDTTCDSFMAQTSDELCRRVGVTREETDAYAVLSHTRTENSVDNGVWSNEIVDVETSNGMVTAADEDHFVRGTSEESLAGLRTHFGPTSLVTAGNASGVVDGAAAVVVKSASQAKTDGDQPLARIVDWGIVGLDPKIMAYGPVPASKLALQRAGMQVDDIDLWEINEAFAGQAVACMKELGISQEIVNINGGAVGLGHPLAATGSRLALTLAHTLKREGKKFGIATACIGGGQGIALIIEAI
ncbi:acetyl-CoA C-acyltransferase [Candidatus Poseidoniales archaeon]|jgi:acetyl-CoA acetyltransferase family protein|uniref:Acetyl-CoA acetyltransferase (AtoB) n=1 Tax=uncultured marine group II/III euryarchaeote KM3_110_E06 TaxID=1457852 RepID=A0A075G7G3_9EURY|nr:acetyl-CoA acetyltransferase (atoB) [uncultured marine group II/III euryarchaeote KM3_110_E06]MCH1511854.1 acetyl-CoA C-acyltransferase [Candidatus Thalassarchaeaceae archaeon]MDC0183599.1 acetyl-CoA C-acyltransferase [Candidatus Poseidoniales archaeon]